MQKIYKINQMINDQKNHTQEIIKEIQNRCDHIWIRESSGGPYPDKWNQCTKCSKIVNYCCK